VRTRTRHISLTEELRAGNNTLYSATANTLPIVGDGPKEKKELAVAAVGKDKIYVISPDINSTKLETYVLDTGNTPALSLDFPSSCRSTNHTPRTHAPHTYRAAGVVVGEDEGR
jgi:hypothetical protein